jgi:hypothetical protein
MNSFAAGLSNRGGKANNNIGHHFCHFILFLSLAALMTQFVHVIDRVLSLFTLSTKSFNPADIMQPWQGGLQKCYLYSAGLLFSASWCFFFFGNVNRLCHVAADF